MSQASPPPVPSSAREENPLGWVIGLALDYVAWTQVIPAVLVWMVALMMLAALALINLDESGVDPGEAMISFADRYPAVSEHIGSWFEQNVAPSIKAATDPETGAVDLAQLDFVAAAARVWLVLSLGGMVIGWIIRLIRGPGPPWVLGRKLGLAGVSSGVLVVLFVAVMVLGARPFEGSAGHWLMVFSGVGVFVFLTTAWAVICAHYLGVIGRRLSHSR